MKKSKYPRTAIVLREASNALDRNVPAVEVLGRTIAAFEICESELIEALGHCTLYSRYLVDVLGMTVDQVVTELNKIDVPTRERKRDTT